MSVSFVIWIPVLFPHFIQKNHKSYVVKFKVAILAKTVTTSLPIVNSLVIKTMAHEFDFAKY